MLPAANRLPKEEISPLLRRGKHVRSDVIELVYRKTNTVPPKAGDTPRFAFIVSKKIDTRATARNRMRRAMSESVRHILGTIKPIDGICIAQRNFADLPQRKVEKTIRSLLPV